MMCEEEGNVISSVDAGDKSWERVGFGGFVAGVERHAWRVDVVVL